MIIKIRFVFLLEMNFKINCTYYYLFRVFNSNCLDYILSSPSSVWQYRLWTYDSRPLLTIPCKSKMSVSKLKISVHLYNEF